MKYNLENKSFSILEHQIGFQGELYLGKENMYGRFIRKKGVDISATWVFNPRMLEKNFEMDVSLTHRKDSDWTNEELDEAIESVKGELIDYTKKIYDQYNIKGEFEYKILKEGKDLVIYQFSEIGVNAFFYRKGEYLIFENIEITGDEEKEEESVVINVREKYEPEDKIHEKIIKDKKLALKLLFAQ